VERGGEFTHVLTIVNRSQLERILERLWDPAEFLSEFGIRSLSQTHAAAPFVLDGELVGYEPAEAVAKIKGGNSNWRGPVWFPTCFLLIESLRKLAKAYGHDFAVATAASGRQSITVGEMARSIADRLIGIFTRPPQSDRRAVFGDEPFFREDP